MSAQKTRLIFIHGINNEGKSADLIREEWGSALNDGLRAAGIDEVPIENIECAYYGDELKKGAEDWSNNRSMPRARKAYEDPELQEFENEINEIFKPRVTVELDEETIELISGGDNNARYGEHGRINTRAAGAHKPILINIAKYLESFSPFLMEKVVEQFLEQSVAYLKDENLRSTINQKVIDDVFSDESQKDAPHIVVTHSNGTLLSYFLIMDRLKDWNIKALYTIGSPLGAKSFQKYLPESKTYPERVDAWYHCWDKEDFVAYDTPLTPSTIGIDGIVNLNTFDTAYEDKHSIVSYLSHAMLARLIASDLDKSFWESPCH